MAGSTEFEQYIIDRVREKRVALGYSQVFLAHKLKVDEKFIYRAEHPSHTATYTLQHLDILARLFRCSPRELLPEVPNL